jgi:hypothetical protein
VSDKSFNQSMAIVDELVGGSRADSIITKPLTAAQAARRETSELDASRQ